MKAVRFYNAKEPLKLEDVVVPELKEGEARIRVKACGICGTDVHIAKEGVLPTAYTPITLGHEIAGEVVEIADNALGIKTRDRIIVYPQELCGICFYCKEGKENLCLKPKFFGMTREGGMAEFINVPVENLMRLPENISFEAGAILADAVATPYHAITARGKLQKGETAAIFGCGGLGFHAIKICKILGANKIVAVDVNEEILQRAKEAGADEVVNAKEEDAVKKIKSLVRGGVDISFEFIGLSKTISSAVMALKRGGRCIVCGIGMETMALPPPFVFVANELQLLGSFGSTKEDIKSVLRLIEEEKLNLQNSITQTFSLNDVNMALEKLYKKDGNPVRFVLQVDSR